ncbi:hypothetical protein DCO58_07675 [Helicobacter saguini]|uniref:Uncharacterized protein n=1 Tax=Helicobacter saguini TaxID=1548018 RepID=A0A347VNF5_9HELI|nr:hypothetical protein [Helicobacter saguini]MWV61789.1 hypothetical protein [Helicobacter saguini]MWV67536.1 hypothetical protein [Helicobacter saguini]MWV69888.1 hypothetical protein [Helicobacter saguini]MWV72895.1 hypothetical protein [Helicobacter saguini]TLD93249.1 hypothetical protein LS64_009040 [Helicobacter saguini]
MKNLVVNLGSKLIDIMFIISCVSVIISGINWMIFISSGFGGFLMALIGTIIGLCAVVLIFFLVYVIIDIRDRLTQITEK